MVKINEKCADKAILVCTRILIINAFFLIPYLAAFVSQHFNWADFDFLPFSQHSQQAVWISGIISCVFGMAPLVIDKLKSSNNG